MSVKQTYSFSVDGTAPKWNSSVTGGTYSSTAHTYTVKLIGTDETKLNDSMSALSSSNVTIKINGTQISTFSFKSSISSDYKTKTFTLTITNYAGGKITIQIDKGALVDTAGNKEVNGATYEFTPNIDSVAPTWKTSITGGTYSSGNHTYSFSLIGTDETALNNSASVLNYDNMLVTVNGTKVTRSNLVFGSTSISSDNKTKTFPITINGFTGGAVVITINSGALSDMTGNKSSEISYKFTIDGTLPVWSNAISGGIYDENAKTYTFKLVGSDETGIQQTTLSSSNVTVTMGGKTANVTFSNGGKGTINDKTITFELTINSFVGGQINISISAGALKDTSNNLSVAKTYSFSKDVTPPTWNSKITSTSYKNNIYTVNVTGTDETALNNSSSTLSSSNVTVTVNGTAVSASNLTFSGQLASDSKSKVFAIGINNFTGGEIKIVISTGALTDTSGNKEKTGATYNFNADIIPPTWENATGKYNPDDQSYTITVTGTDDIELNTSASALTTSNSTLTVGGTAVTPTITKTASTSKSVTYEIKISKHTGGAISFKINAGALKDAQNNTSAEKTYTFTAVDAVKPTWASNISGGTYSNGTYSFSVVGSDETKLDTSKSVLSSSNFSVTTSGNAVSSSDITFGSPTLSSDGKTKTFPITIKNFKGGQVNITIAEKALYDTTGNWSVSKTYSFYKDITPPVWDDSIQNPLYNHSTKGYYFELVGTDETKLNTSSSTLTTSNVKITVGGTNTTNFTLGTATTSSDSKTKTFPITLNSYTGGEIIITVSAGALKDTAGNSSAVKEYKITPDITKPVWSYQNLTYDPDSMTYSVELVGTDETALNTNVSTLISTGSSKNLLVTCGGTSVTPTLEKTSTTSTKIIYKLTINDYPGGAVAITISEGALIDTSSNRSDHKVINLPEKDRTKPTLKVQNNNYSDDSGQYTFEVVATDETAIDTTRSNLAPNGSSKNITVKCGNTTIVPSITSRNTSDGKSIIYTVTISEYPGGTVSVAIDAGAIYDTTGNKSNSASFTLPAADVQKPQWADSAEFSYDENNSTVSITLTGTDDVGLNDSKSVLNLSTNLVIYNNGAVVSSENIKLGTPTISQDKLTKKFPITLNNFAGGTTSIAISKGALVDNSGKTSDAKTYNFTDMIKPKWYMDGNGSYNTKSKEYTITLDARDDTEIKTVNLTTSTMTVTVGGTAVTPTITQVTDGIQEKRYTITIPNYTGGTINITLNAGTIVDTAGNASIQTPFSVTPDVTAPLWKAGSAGYVNATTSDDVTIELLGTDNTMLATSSLTKQDLIVKYGEEIIDYTNLELSAVTYTNDGKGGVKYVLTIHEYQGSAISIFLPAGTLTDQAGNTSVDTTLAIESILPPEDTDVPTVSGTQVKVDNLSQVIYITFDITDMSFDYTHHLTAEDFEVTKTYKVRNGYWGTREETVTITPTIEIVRETRLTGKKGYRYKIKLTNVDITTTPLWGIGGTQSNPATIKVYLNKDAMLDRLSKGNEKTLLMNQQVTFESSTTDAAISLRSAIVNNTDNDKNLTIQLTVNKSNSWWGRFFFIPGAYGGSTATNKKLSTDNIYDLRFDGVSVGDNSAIDITVEELTSSSTTTGGGFFWNKGTTTTTAVYRIILSNLEEALRQNGKSYKEWSGCVELDIGPSSDTIYTVRNEDEDLEGFEYKNTQDILFVDVIKPELEVNGVTINDEESDSATVNLQATDKYFSTYYTTNQTASFDKTKIYLTADGVKATEEETGVKLQWEKAKDVTETRNSEKKVIGITQSVTITGMKDNLDKKLKLVIEEGACLDNSGNPNERKEISLFSRLMSASTETAATSTFLNNPYAIQRQNVQSVEFRSSTTGLISNCAWDVSENQDGSIMAWYDGTGPYRVYIASDGLIYANPDSSYLFSYVGYATNCTDTTVVKNLNLLNTKFATKMDAMFNYTGYRSMTGLSLGDKFDTSNVTSMNRMFDNCGYTRMGSLNLGTAFDTTKVTSMSLMFRNCGYTAMTSMELGTKFNTSKVENMTSMFYYTGYTAMTTLKLGNYFYTKSATNMSQMFNYTGASAMTSLDLGPAFTKIADTNTNFATGCGKNGSVTIYVGSSIYSTKNAFKLSADVTTTISYARGTINPKYKPDWTKVSTTLNTTDKNITVKLQGNVNTANYTGDALKSVINRLAMGTGDSSKITVKIDGTVANNLVKTVQTSVKGPANTVTAEIIISSFAETTVQSGKTYLEWAGNIAMQLAQGTLTDAYGNPNLAQLDGSAVEIKDATIDKNTDGKMFADFIKPKLMYEQSSVVVDKTVKTVTIVFSITDKYYASESLDVSKLSIRVDGTDVSEIPSIKKTLTKSTSSTGVKYTLVLSEFEQDSIASGKRYLDYSGSITVTVPAGAVLDKSGNGNVTEGLGIGPQNTIVKDNASNLAEIDLVRPSWQLQPNKGVTLDFASKTVTIPLEVTDKYFSTSTLTNNIKLLVNGAESTSGGTISIQSGPTNITETRGGNTVLIGHSYTVKITNISVDSGQLGVRILEGAASDTSGNTSSQKDILLLNRLKETNTETAATSGFLGSASNTNATIKAIQRQNINKVVFESGISSAVYNHTTKTISDATRAWDVSKAGDQSIVAWFVDSEKSNGTYVIHIGSEGGILANTDSSYLFANIGSSANCKSIVAIANLSLLDVSTVTNMNYMFTNTGKQAMTELDLGTNFSTSSVTTMVGMFQGAGYNAMTTLTLGNLFVTTKVTDMNNMFNETGYKALKSLNLSTFNTASVTNMQRMFRATGHDSMTTLTLGSNFNTAKVTNMLGMFANCGYGSLTALNLGGAFDTGNVTDMSYMFTGAGHDSMTGLNLGSLFKTSKVTNMSYMFQNTGAGKMTTLTLGSNFNTSAVTNMSYMFNGTGSSSMQSLVLGGYFYTSKVTNMTSMFEACGQGSIKTIDLGPAFTNVSSTNTNMLKTLNNTNIYTGTAIYSNENAVRLNLNSSTTVSFERGKIIAKYQPEWQKSTTTPDTANTAITVVLRGIVNATNYAGYNKNITNKFANGTTTQITVAIDGESTPNSRIIKTISGASSTEAESVQCNVRLTGFNEGYISSKGYKEWSGNVALNIPQGTLTDAYGNPNLAQEIKEDAVEKNTAGDLFLDSIKPEIIYEYSETTINHDSQTVTVGFRVTDKYFANTLLTVEQLASQITVKVDSEAVNVEKEVREIKTLNETVNGQNRTVGKKYELVISKLDQGDGIRYSGPMQVVFPAGIAKDASNNTNAGKTISIGVDDPVNDAEHKSEIIVDVVKPVWSVENLKITQVNGKAQATMDLIGTDKYLNKTNSKSLTPNEIKVFVDGVDITSIATGLSKSLAGPIDIDNGIKYTLTITNLEESYDAFIAARNANKRVYREYSGDVTLEVPEGKLVDNSGNKSSKLSVKVGIVDTLKPEIVKVSSTVNPTAKTETIIFDVTDKYFGTILDEQTLLSKLHVFVDEEAADSITKQITNVETLTDTVDGISRTVGKRYTLVLSNFEKEGLQSGYEFKGISGTVKVTVDAEIATDSNGNTSNSATLAGDFTDFIEPSVVYRFSKPASGANSVTITFDVTDKYYKSGDLTLADLALKMQNGKDLSNYIDMKTISGAQIQFGTPSNVTCTTAMNKTVNGTVQKGLTNQIIGRRYTITISNLEQAQIKDGDQYLEYSGNVQIGVAKGKVKDQENNTNLAQTITFGINLPEGTGIKEALDIVKPIWSVELQTVDLDKQEATIIVKGTDKYFSKSTLTNDTLQLIMNGSKVTTNDIASGRTLEITGQKEIYEDWIENGVTSQHLVGVEYTIIATGFDVDKGQVKIRIPEATLTDNSGNSSNALEFMLYSCLKATNTETSATSGFLGNTSIQRQNIESVTFESGLSKMISSTKWDVSDGNDGSIMAWYKTAASGALEVYIGGTTAIFANPNSSYLFANIGTATKCTATEVVKNLDLVTTKRVTNMSYMFLNTGTTAMTTLNLGSNFNTEKVTNMTSMFNGCGINKMSTLNLGGKFYTSEVTLMNNMFNSCGRYALTALNLGEYFDTSKVTDMAGMFNCTGSSQMTSFNIGKKFDTTNVTNMSWMFNMLGNAKLTSLDLGDLFYTTNVTNMDSMFYNCGSSAMTTIDLGPAFTKIAGTNTNFATNFGKSGATLNVPEAIYQDSKNFRLGIESTTTLAYSRGTITPKYRTEWVVTAKTIDKTNKTVKITLRGRTNSQLTITEYPGGANGLLNKDKVTVLVDGTNVKAVQDSMEISSANYITNSSTNKVEVEQVITLKDFVEDARQTGKSYKEWSGNISLKIAKDSGLKDDYGSENIAQDINNIILVDVVKPEFTYKYSSTDINYTNKTLTVEFDVVDKYFSSTTLSATNAVNNITVKMIDTNAVPANITKTLKKKTISADQTSGSITYKANGDIYENSRKIGERYTLVISGLEQASKSADGKYKDYSGPMSVAFPAGVITDTSGNTSDQITITVGIDEPDKSGMQEIVDVVTPIWEAKSTTIDKWNKRAIIKLQGTDKYYASNSLDTSKITVYVDGKEITNIEKTLSESTPLTETRNGQEMQYGVEYTLTLSGFSEPDSEFMTARKNGSREYREYSGKTEVKIVAGTLSDAHNTNKEQTISLGDVDCLKPDIIYEASNTTIDQGNKILTVVFEVTDKYYNASASSLKLSDLTVTVDEKTMTSAELTASGNSLTATALSSGKGTKYTLVIKNLQQNPNDGVDYSGIVSIAIPSGKFADTTGNTNDAKTITIGVDTPTNDENHNTGTIVDVVSPVWKAENFRASSDNTQILVDLVGTDKYLDTSKTSVDPSKIKVLINNQDIEATSGIAVNKSIEYKGTRSDILTGAKDVIYTLTLSNFKESDETFLAARAAGTRLYREYSGFTQIEMPAGQLKDTSNNTNVKTTLDLGNIDRLPPEVVKVSSTVDKTNKKETIVFDIVDKYLKTSALGTTTTEANNNLSKLHVFVDDEAADNITKKITKVEKLTDTIGTTTNQLIGYRYTLELTNFEKSKNSKGVKDWSGTVRVDVDAAVAIDTNGNTSDETSIECDFVDLIKPYLEYTHQSSDISTTNKTYTMKFRITDKYYKSGKLTLNDLTVKIKNGQLKNGSEIVYNLSDLAKAGTVTLSLSDTEVYANDINITDETTGEVGLYTSQLIGYEYTLKISNLEKLQIADGMTTADYSGIISVGIAANKVLDRTYNGSNNGNTASTITSGVNIPNGSGNGIVVDVVDPLIKGVGTVADPTKGTATLTFRATDSYFASSSISAANIQIYVNGEQKAVGVASGDGITKTLSQTSKEELRLQNGTTSNKQYGIEYTLNITGYPSNINQLRVVIPAGLVADESGNHNKEKAFNLFNTLATAEANASATTAFMGNTYGIQRGKIAQIVFESYIGGTSSTRWDVSAQKDQSIMAWYNANEKPTSDTYIIHIGSETLIGANVNSSNWFSYIGYDANCKATSEESDPIIKNLKIISVANVTNMSNMFAYLGYSNMTTFSLSSNFYTTSATNMSGMFKYAGFTKMTTLNLGANFNTSKVTNMSSMFNHTGYTAMTGLNLGSAFHTNKVTNMAAMFGETGYTAMTSLNLGTNFVTNAVTDMSWMFSACGHEKMTTLTLGSNFNTSSVTTMQGMFNSTGTKLLTSLDLGDLFYTTNVENMTNMFSNCGTGVMTSLDLGPAFTKIASTNTNFATNLGKSGFVAYAPEAIYQDSTHFRLGGAGSTAIACTSGRTINPKYRTEWVVETTAFNTTNKTLAITLRGRTNSQVTASEYKSDVSGEITDKTKVEFYMNIGGTLTKMSNVSISLGTASQTTQNASKGTKEVLQTITIGNLEETARQSGKLYKEYSGNIIVKVLQDSGLKDSYGNGSQNIDQSVSTSDVDKNTTGKLFADFIKPEFNYLSSETTINHNTKTVTILFSVRDKYFSTSGLTADTTASKISVTVADEDVNSKITKKLEIAEEEKDVINGKNQKVGEKYRLTITGLDHKDGTHYSGIMQLGFAKDLVVDLSGNKNDAQTITIGVDTPNGSGSGSIVDVVDPVWNTQNFTIDKTNKKITVDLIGTDKYYLSDSLTTDKIKVFVDGKEASSITKQLSDSSSVTNGVKYTLTLSGWEETSEQTENIYKEWSGITKIQIAAGTLKDKYTNTSKQHEFTLGHVDFIKPVIKKASSSKNATNGTETILFNVIDKYLDTTSTLSANDITVYVDKVEATGLTKTLTKTSTQFTASINGSTQVVGQQYQLVLSGFKQARSSIDSTKNYTEWSGTVSIDVATGKIKDKIVSPNTTANTNNQTTIYGDFVDFIKPEITYKYAASDINYTNKTFTMDFEITDKYFNSITELTTQNITQYVTIKVDGVDITNNTAITKEIISTTNVTAGTTAKPINKTVNGTVQTGLTNQVIGRHYKLRISGLQQAIKTGNTLDYSGVITVAFKEGIATDTTTNKNAATTITSGVNLPGGSGSGTIVDVVDPMWEQIGRASVEAGKGTASMVIRGTDKYLNKVTSALTSGKITVTVNGTTPTTTVTVNVQEDTSISETWAKQYKVTLTGFDPKAYQVAFKIPAGVLVDGYGNTSKEKEFILFSSLKKTNTETASTSLFLGITGVQRQNVEQVIFEEYIDDSKTLFDVSAAQDRTIMAWYEKTSRNTYIVHIGSTIIINGNQDSTNLFNYVGYSTNCAVTNEASNKIIKNIELLHVDNVTNMKNMFAYLGYGKMQTFSLGSAFDTTNVTDMSGMFQYTGFAAMTSIDLAGKFNTINVTKMNSMFDHTGYTAMTGLNLGGKFNTAKVTEMSSMFADTGYTKMTTLNLGGEFSTLKVTKMDWMFKNCGHEALTALNLGSKFNTSIVQTMEGMFNATGYKAMVSLDLGDNFYTSTVTNMDNMFDSTGAVSMMALDMGPNFKKIAAKHVNFATNCGKKDVVIYAPEVIYSTQTSFKLGI